MDPPISCKQKPVSMAGTSPELAAYRLLHRARRVFPDRGGGVLDYFFDRTVTMLVGNRRWVR